MEARAARILVNLVILSAGKTFRFAKRFAESKDPYSCDALKISREVRFRKSSWNDQRGTKGVKMETLEERIGVLRLRGCFAKRSSPFAQDDTRRPP
jgi:hypothetical protein